MTLWDARPPDVQRVSRLVRSAVTRHVGYAATEEALLDGLRQDQTITDTVRTQSLALLARRHSIGRRAIASDCEVVANLSDLSSLKLEPELLHVRSNRTIEAIRFDDVAPSNFSTSWFDDPQIIGKPNARTAYVPCTTDLEPTHESGGKPFELRRFSNISELTLHPSMDRIVWCRHVTPRGMPELILSRLDGSAETNVGFGYCPIWSVDGKTLIHVGGSEENGWFMALREVPENGSDLLREKGRIKVLGFLDGEVIPNPSPVSLSPDGRLIAYSTIGEDGTMQIGLTSLEGTGSRQLTRMGDLRVSQYVHQMGGTSHLFEGLNLRLASSW